MRPIDTIEEIQHMHLRLLRHVDAYCKENGILYYLAYGTLLGAVRHSGFIPWDDDIDIWMLRPHYDKFVEEFPQYASCHSLYLNELHEGLGYEKVFSKVCDSRTFTLEGNKRNYTGQGIALDVFPVDGLPSNNVLSFSHLTYLQYQKVKALSASSSTQISGNTGAAFGVKRLIKQLLSHSSISDSVRRYNAKARQVSISSNGRVCFASPGNSFGRNVSAPANAFREQIRISFEDEMYPVPIGYDTLLTILYGNYMELPPEENRIPHHTRNLFMEE